MKRRTFMIAMGAAAALARSAFGQNDRGRPRIGFLGNGPASEHRLDAFVAGLRENGLIDGREVTVTSRFADGDLDRLPTLVEELVRAKIDVIVVAGPVAVRAALKAANTMPIVVAVTGDPIAAGFVPNLAHPGGKLTGLSMNDTDIAGKRIELIKELTPSIARIAALYDASSTIANVLPNVESAAQSLGIALEALPVTLDDLDRAFAAAQREHAQAVLVLPTPLFNIRSRRQQLASLALRYRLPSMYEEALYVRDGGLMSYGPDFADMYRRSAGYVAKILRGAKPGDLPIEQPTKFQFAVNLKTAQALGITVPQSLLAQADEVIE